MANLYLPEVRAGAVQMVFERQGPYETQAGAIAAIAPKNAEFPRLLSGCVKQGENDSGMRVNEIIRKASAYFAQAELDRPLSDDRLHSLPGRRFAWKIYREGTFKGLFTVSS